MKELLSHNKTFLKIYATIMGLVVLLSLFHFNKITFFLLSILVNTLIINVIIETKRLLKVKFSKTDYGIIIGMILIVYLFYELSILTRQFVYYWDYACYYNIQLDTIARFEESLFSGIRYFVGSTWSGEYGNFLSFIPQFFFTITTKTPNNYVTSCIVVFTPYIILALSIFIKKWMKELKSKKPELLLGLSLLCFILFPIYHATAIFGQPDYFGLFFIFIIISITLSYDFKKLELERLIILFISTYCLFISRRWYVYWILSYYICYGIGIILLNYKDKKKIRMILKNASIFAEICVILFVGTLFPLIKNILVSDYKSHYIYYLSGGILIEMASQKAKIGFALLMLMIIGFVIGIIKKEYRKYTIIATSQIVIIIFLFTRIQNMGNHHTLTLLPSYLFFIFILMDYLLRRKKGIVLNSFIVGVMILNFTSGLIGNHNPLFTDIPLKVPKQTDYNQIEEVATWLKENLSDEKKAYMITHTDRYNPDKFRTFFMPDRTIEYYLPYGSAVIGVHKFPTELFTAKYILTTTPYESISMEYKYEEVFEELVKEEKFSLIKTFDMKNKYQVLIYERVKEVDQEEINMYKEKLKEESKQFPELYEKIIEEYEIGKE